MSLLTPTHREHFDEHGYMVIENAVPVDLCNAVVEAIFAFLEMDPNNPNDWYRAPHKPGAGMVEMYQHQACGTSTSTRPFTKFLGICTALNASGCIPIASI